jgi:tricorn protease
MKRFVLMLILIAGFSITFADEARILRYPNSSSTHVTFTHGGDVYIAPINGGDAIKVTNSEGVEMYPRFSPDGQEIAFTSEYDGNREIYTMPYKGGVAKRLTYSMDASESLPERMGPDKIIMQWTNDGKQILFRGRGKSWNIRQGKLFYANTDASQPEELPLFRSGFAHLSPDGKKIVHNRIFREYRTWKRYRGGQADDIWLFDFETKESENISDNPAQDIIPMWAGNKIYYISDRSNVMNLYSYDLTTKATNQITNFTEYDVKFPSLGKEHIAFQNGGYIYLMRLDNEEVKKLTINISNDYPELRPEYVNVKDKISSMDLSPEANRAVITARGDIFSVPAKKGRIYNLTKSSGAHDRAAVWSPDGKWLAYISDKSGEDEIYITSYDGKEEIKLTNDGNTYRYQLKWSPDSKYLLCSDKMMRLYYIDVLTKEQTEITRSPYWEITDFTWSYDSKWVAFTGFTNTLFSIINLYSLETGDITQATSEFFQSSTPEFSKDGKYLFFVSGRTFNGRSGAFEYNVTYNDMNKIYGVTLRNDIQNPFAKYEEDEVVLEDDSKKKDKDDKNYTIETENIMDRIFELPVSAGNYGNLTSTEDGKLYYVKSKTNENPATYYYDLEEKEENKVGDFRGFTISKDEKHIAFRAGQDYYIEKLNKT